MTFAVASRRESGTMSGLFRDFRPRSGPEGDCRNCTTILARSIWKAAKRSSLHAKCIVVDRSSVWGRFNGGRDGTLWYYRQLVQVFRAANSSFLIEELDRVVTELERLAVEAT